MTKVHVDPAAGSVRRSRRYTLAILVAGLLFAAIVAMIAYSADSDPSRLEPAAGMEATIPDRVPPSEELPERQ